MIQVAGVLIVQGDEYILQHRDNKPTIAEPGTYSLWGGTLESGETPAEGAIRELQEETSVILQPESLRQLANFMDTGKEPASFGKPVKVYLYTPTIDEDTTAQCLEGQGVVRLAKYSELNGRLNQFAKQAIELYETAAR